MATGFERRKEKAFLACALVLDLVHAGTTEFFFLFERGVQVSKAERAAVSRKKIRKISQRRMTCHGPNRFIVESDVGTAVEGGEDRKSVV